MALNLNKGNNETNNSASNQDKKGFNLNKSDSTPKSTLNLSKETINSEDTINSNQNDTNSGGKKKSPVLAIILVLALVGGGIFWVVNRDNSNSEKPEMGKNDTPTSTTQIADVNTGATQGNADQTPNETNSTNADVNMEETPVNEAPSGTTDNADNLNNTQTNASSNKQKSNNSSSNPIETTQVSGSLESRTKQVIGGNFGNGADRKKALGNDYEEIQAKVNEWYQSRKQ